MNKLKIPAAVVGLALVAAACGGDDADDAADVAPAVTEAAEDDMAEDDMAEDDMAEDEMAEDDMADDDMAEDDMADDEMADDEMAEDDMAEDDMAEDEMAEDDMADTSVLELSFSGLEPLGPNAVYEGWVIVDGSPVSTGRFDVGADGGLIDDAGNTIDAAFTTHDASAATAVVVSIEPFDDPDPAPAATKVLAGDVVDGVADLSIAHPAALGTDFADAGGFYILATPTNGDGNDERSGVWFLERGPGNPVNLPELPAGWVYEGWAVVDGQPLSTGRFTDPNAADDFDGFSGDQPGPAKPGEDFIINAPEGLEFPLDLRGATIVISVEPDPDDSEAPFALKPLVAEVPADAVDHDNLPLGVGPAAPTGVATIG
ncbi:MAG: hypothetical protein QNJ12_12405 [Ilumatobacter sp.]|uniref:hypothetical protein n=1 Tax=Ilumatobacter sp. TaxID=1967498 RepID=UPI00260D6CA5|nr:hypothetical protein [Ilumatobacter sp.]MDJ0769594.1 hypothetical protein [Ilumatobacter sp.]